MIFIIKGGCEMEKRWTKLLAVFVYVFLFALTMSGCATITKGGSQSITINTNPSGASCTLSREGNTIGVVNPTPGTVNIEKDKDTISVVCKKDGFCDEGGTIDAEFQGMTWGNIIFGGLIGLAVDAGSGALHKYQSILSLTLIPTEFNTVVEKDAFFDGLKADCLSEYSKLISKATEKCNMEAEENKDSCKSDIKGIEDSRNARLQEIEKKRIVAKVRS